MKDLPLAQVKKGRYLLNNASTIIEAARETGMADITSEWAVYTKEYLLQGNAKNLTRQNPFSLNRMVTMKDGSKCPFVILPADMSGEFDYIKCGNEKMAHFQIFSVLINGEPDSLEDY